MHRSDDNPKVSVQRDNELQKPYSKPALIVHGHLRDLVQGPGGSSQDSVSTQATTIIR
jgi:hypothetical protein